MINGKLQGKPFDQTKLEVVWEGVQKGLDITGYEVGFYLVTTDAGNCDHLIWIDPLINTSGTSQAKTLNDYTFCYVINGKLYGTVNGFSYNVNKVQKLG